MDKKLLDILDASGIEYLENAPLSELTTFRTGGRAALVVYPKDEAQTAMLIGLFGKELTVLGNGSNVLASDCGYDGVILTLQKYMTSVHIEGNIVTADAGIRLSKLVLETINSGLSGLEFAAGIPGTLGGGIYMNAGAYDGTLSEFISSVRAMDKNGYIHTIPAEDCAFDYRHSIFMERDLIILGCTFILRKGDRTSSVAKVNDLNQRRKSKQPLEYPSAGSTFKRPSGHYAGALIDASGLKGCTIGGAQVSEKHAGFIINKGDATSKDVYELIEHVRKKVLEDSGVELEPEVRFLGRFDTEDNR